MEAIEDMATVLDCPVLLTLQHQGNPDMYGPSSTTWGPMLMDHGLHYLLKMNGGSDDTTKASLSGHAAQPDSSIQIGIRGDEFVAQEILD